jgi:hypothetical protein
MFIHHVFFWLKSGSTEADRSELIKGLQAMTSLDLFKQWHIGVPADTHRDVVERSYGVSWMVLFESAADEAIYQDHPEHHHFIATCKHLWEKVVVYDAVSI